MRQIGRNIDDSRVLLLINQASAQNVQRDCTSSTFSANICRKSNGSCAYAFFQHQSGIIDQTIYAGEFVKRSVKNLRYRLLRQVQR